MAQMAGGNRGEVPPHPLRDYALLADGERGAILGPQGEIVWMCAPRWHSDAVFASLIGGAGSYGVTPAGRYVWGGYYEQGTLIWRGEGRTWPARQPVAAGRRSGRARPRRPRRLRRAVARPQPAAVAVSARGSGQRHRGRIGTARRRPGGEGGPVRVTSLRRRRPAGYAGRRRMRIRTVVPVRPERTSTRSHT